MSLNTTHHFDVRVAKELGINSAVLLANMIYWIEKNEANETNYHEGKYWTYNSIKAYGEIFPYLSERQIRYALDKLEEENIVITGNFNKVGFDKTKWYTLSDYGKSYLQSVMFVYTLCLTPLYILYKRT